MRLILRFAVMGSLSGCLGLAGASNDAGFDAGVSADAGAEARDGGVDAGASLVDAGPPPTLMLNGRDWSPNRADDGTVLLTDFAQLPANFWVRVAGARNTVRAVQASPPYPSSYGPDGFGSIVGAWGGAAWDALNLRLNLSGGGHGDASAAQTEIIAVDARTMRAELVVPRQPLASALRWNMASAKLEAGEGYPGGTNAPLATGVPGSMHTYHGLRWLSPAVMAELHLDAPTLGGLFYPGNARAVVNLDTGAYTTLFWKTAYWDISYISAVVWKHHVIFPRGSFYFSRWDMAQTEMTDWQGAAAGGFNPTPSVPAFGKDLEVRTSSKALTYGGRVFIDRPSHGEFISLADSHQRVRYGAAEDADASDWSSYQDTVTLTGPAAADLNTPSLFTDTGTNRFNNAGGAFDEATGDLFVCPNTTDAPVFRIEGLATGQSGAVTSLAGTEPLTVSGNGTYGRFVVFNRGGARLALRVSSVDHPFEVMRLAGP